MSLTKKVAMNTLVQVVGRFLGTLIMLIVVMYLARYLGTSGFGEYTTIMAFALLFGSFADFGLYLISMRELAKAQLNPKVLMNNILGLRLVIILAILLFVPIVAYFSPYSTTVKWGILIASLASLSGLISQVFGAIFQTNFRIDKQVYAEVFARTVILGLVIWFIKMRLSLISFIWAALIGNLIMILTSFILVRKYLKIRPGFNFAIWKRIFKEVWPLGLAMILGIIIFKNDTILLSILPFKMDLANMRAVGIYGAPYKIVEVLVAFPGMFLGAAFPILSGYFWRREEKFVAAFQKSFDFLAICAVPLAFGLFLLAPFIMPIVVGTGFTSEDIFGAVWSLRALAFAVGFSFLGSFANHIIIAIGKQFKMIWQNLFILLVSLSLNFLFIPLYAYKGAAIISILTHSLIFLTGMYIIFRYTRIIPHFGVLLKSIVAGLVMTGVIFLLIKGNFLLNWTNFSLYNLGIKILGFMILFLVASFVYFVSLYLIKGFSKESLAAVMKG